MIKKVIQSEAKNPVSQTGFISLWILPLIRSIRMILKNVNSIHTKPFVFNSIGNQISYCTPKLYSSFFSALIVITFTPFNLLSQQPDTLSKTTDEINVSADKPVSSPAMKYNSLVNIDTETIERKAPLQVNEILEQIPGLHIKNYGGLGGLKTISLRGTSSRQSLVLLNGMKLNSSQNGSLDLSSLPVILIESIEVMKGGGSSLFGSSAMGGAVNIQSGNITDNFLLLNISAASFRQYYFGIKKGWDSDNYSTGILAEYVNGKGNYPFIINEYGKETELIRKNGDFSNLSLGSTFNYKNTGTSINALLLFRDSKRGVPGAVIPGNAILSDSRMTEQEVLFNTNIKNDIGNGVWSELSALTRLNEMQYCDPSQLQYDPVTGLDNLFTNREVLIKPGLYYIGDSFRIDLNLEGSYSDLRGDMLQENTGNMVSRRSFAIASGFENYFIDDSAQALSFQTSVRFDAVSDAGNAFSPTAGLIYSWKTIPVNFRAAFSGSFRAPSFNEMYYLNFGNDDLKPEKSNSFNFGVDIVPFEFIQISSDAFLITTKDRIISIPISPIQWSSKNLGETRSIGFEVSSSIDIMDMLNINLSYTRQEATNETDGDRDKGKILVYTPQELLAIRPEFNVFDITIIGEINYTGFTYFQTDNSINSLIHSYTLVNISVNYDFQLLGMNTSLKLLADNIFNKQYSVIANYPMPGRLFRLAMGFKI